MSLQSKLFGGLTRQLVYKSLNSNTMRGRAISQNLANVSTPDYKRKEVDFERQVREAMSKKIDGETTNAKHLNLGRVESIKKANAYAYEVNDPTLAGEINNVDVDLEASKMAENQIQYEYNIKFAGFNKFMSAIRGSAVE